MTGRQVPAAADNHAAYSHEQLKQWTDAADPRTSQSVADEWAKIGSGLLEAADSLKRASADSETGWTGEAADAMRARLGLIHQWSSRTGAQVTTASQGVARQSEAADTARRSMPEPVPYDPAGMIRDAQRGGLIDMAMLPQRLVAQKEAHDAAHTEAVRVVAERDGVMSAAAARTEVFEPPPGIEGSSATERPFVGARDPGGPGVAAAPQPAGGSPAPREPAANGATVFGSAPIPRRSGDSPSGPGSGEGVGVLGDAPADARADGAGQQRPEFLREPEPDGIFDTGVLTAPAVIGGPDEG